MKDELEKYITENREAFDDKMPDIKVWDKIESEIGRDFKKKYFNYTILWKVAAVFFFASSVYLFTQLNKTGTDGEALAPMTSSNLYQEFEEAEAYYVLEIGRKQASLTAAKKIDPILTESFQTDISHLDSIYTQLKNEFSENKNEQVINALIQNLQLRIEILNEQLMILENVKNTVDNENINI